MTYAERKWEMLKICHERLLDLVGVEKLHSLMESIHKTGMYLALAYADFRCQDCKRGDKLSLQHIVRKVEGKYTDQVRFFRMRHHWQNIFVLCSACHIKADNLANSEDTFLTLSDERVRQIKNYFHSGSTIADAPMLIVDDIMKDINVHELKKETQPTYYDQEHSEKDKPLQTKKKLPKPKVIPYFEDRRMLETW